MIGMSCTHFSSRPMGEWIDRVAGSFHHWEIFSEADHIIVGREAEIRDMIGSRGMTCSVHAPICDLNVGALTDRLMEASVEVLRDTIRSASEIDAVTVTIHPGLSSMSVNDTEVRASERARRSMKVLEKAGEEYGVTLAIENMPIFPFFLGRTASSLADIVDGTDLGICFDIGHANTMGQIDAMVETFGDRIVNVHIHDNHGQRDEHLTIGDGDIDFPHVLDLLSSYRGNYIIESKDFASAVESHSRLEKMLS